MCHKPTNTLIETLAVREGALRHTEWHQERIERTARTYGLNLPHWSSFDSAIRRAITSFPAAKKGTWRCTITYSETITEVRLIPYTPRLITRLQPIVVPPDFAYDCKWSDRSLFTPFITEMASDTEPLFVRNGVVTDTTFTNIVAKIDGEWLTPTTPLLQGTARARLLSEGRIHTHDLTLADLSCATEIHLINAMLPLGTITPTLIFSNKSMDN